MLISYLIIFFILGTLFGSFFTVVGERLPRGENFINNRSYCDACHHKLSFLDMVPILSYLFLRGKCRYCQKKIDDLSTYMELFTGILFSLSYFSFGFSWDLLIALGIVSMLIIISVSDITYYVIPDGLLIFFSIYFSIIIIISKGILALGNSILSGICLFGVMYLIMIIGNFIFKKDSLGGGDIKLMFVFGLIISPLLGLFAIFLGSFLALPVALIMLRKKKQKLVPFGPFLLISFAFIYFTKIDTNMILSFLRLK